MSDDVTIYVPPSSLSSGGGWGLAFFQFARQNPRFQVTTEIKEINEQSLNIIVVSGSIAADAVSHLTPNNTAYVLMPDVVREELPRWVELVESARSAVVMGKFDSRNESILVLPHTKYVSHLQTSEWRESEFKDDLLETSLLRRTHISLFAPRSFLCVWESFISLRAIPERLDIYISAHDRIPEWFLDNLAEYDVGVSVVDLSYETFYSMRDSSQVFLRDQGELDVFDILGFEFGIRIVSFETDGRTFQLQVPPEDSVVSVSDLVGWIVGSTERKLGKVSEGGSGNFDMERSRSSDLTSDESNLRNIVCFRPSYLFRDLVERFVEQGWTHSDVALAGADRYIWMRPQEYIATADLMAGLDANDVPVPASESISREWRDRGPDEIQRLSARSVVIHHGIVPPPSYQFNASMNATRLWGTRAVAGVCPFDMCYRGVEQLACRGNFHFIPIGYDAKLFSEERIRRDSKGSGAELQIGFVGRAYGTNSVDLLAKSKTATPVGYIKGGDLLVNICLRLLARGILFRLHLVGNGWKDIADLLVKYGVACKLYERDSSVKYTDYPEIFSSFDLLLITSRGESGPVPAVEAMSVGVPVVGSDSAGMVKYLNEIGAECLTFSYNAKWHLLDYAKAVDHIESIYGREVTLSDRKRIRQRVSDMTTQIWVSKIIDLAAR